MLQVRQVLSLVTSHPYLPFCRHIITILHFISVENRVHDKTQKRAAMGQLPAQRVVPHSPFQITGVDYAGPPTLKRGNTRKPVLVKSYLAIFVCLPTKAVHIEVVETLSTEDFFAGLKRFVARRGLPSELHSDNGKNFIGARNDLYELYRFLQPPEVNSAISNYLLTQRIKWVCIPERSPHFGGLWEAAVKSTKHHLRRIAGQIRFTNPESNTVTCQIEACLNSRPLMALNSHILDGISVLTPGHFLVGRPLTAYPETLIQTEPSLLTRWTMCQAVVHHFWTRWSREYLQQLQSLSKWRHTNTNLQVGDVVVIRDDNPFMCHWPTAIVVETYPGRDELVRVVLLKTVSFPSKTLLNKNALVKAKPNFTMLKRPITKLALIHRESPSTLSPGSGTGVPAPGSMSEP